MNTLLKLEMLGLFFLSVWLWRTVGMDDLGLEWWWYLVWFLVPDFSMVGYLVNPKVGAWIYNLAHHFGVVAACIIGGAMFGFMYVELAGVIMLGHSALDRALGYGLKYSDSFKHTHLGWLK